MKFYALNSTKRRAFPKRVVYQLFKTYIWMMIVRYLEMSIVRLSFSSLNKTDLYMNLLEQNSVSTTKLSKIKRGNVGPRDRNRRWKSTFQLLVTHVLVYFKEIPNHFIDRIYGMTWVSSESIMLFMNVY